MVDGLGPRIGVFEILDDNVTIEHVLDDLQNFLLWCVFLDTHLRWTIE